MIEVIGLIQQKYIRKAQPKENGSEPVPQSNGDKKCKKTQHHPMDIHVIFSPGLNPPKSRKGKEEIGTNIVPVNPVFIEIPGYFPEHYKSKANTEKYQGRDIYLPGIS